MKYKIIYLFLLLTMLTCQDNPKDNPTPAPAAPPLPDQYETDSGRVPNDTASYERMSGRGYDSIPKQ